jgi:hypothetical protein
MNYMISIRSEMANGMDGDCKYYKHVSDKIKEIVTLITVEVEKRETGKKHREDVQVEKIKRFSSPSLTTQHHPFRIIKSGYSKTNHALSKLKNFPRHDITLNVDSTLAPWPSHVHYNCGIYRHSS